MGAYWQKMGWNKFVLVAPGFSMSFPDYDALYRFCRKAGIDARQS